MSAKRIGNAVAEFFRKEMMGLLRTIFVRSSPVLLLFVVSGCALFIPNEPIPPPPPELPPIVEAEPEVIPTPTPRPAPVQEPAPEIVADPQNIEPLVAIVLSDRTPAYVEVATALDKHLENYEVYDLNDRSQSPKNAFAAIAESEASAIVAVGLPAARASRRFSTVPVVIGQVFNLHDDELLSAEVKAVAVLPPIGLQIDSWHELDPSIRNVGAILGPGHDVLIAEADEAMKERGVKFHYAIAESDRETLYLFNRLVRDIDGFILFPDNRILSRSVLSEMMSYATRHRVQVSVFNEQLLEYGAVFSASAVESDIAATIARVLDKVVSGNIDAVPPVSNLSKIDVHINDKVLRDLGLDGAGINVDNTLVGAQ